MSDKWKAWKDNPTEQTFDDLYKAHEKAIDRGIQMFSGKYNNPLPPGAIKAQAIVAFDDAIKTYNPGQGVALDTWITTKMRTLQRYTRDNKDIAHIPENRLIHIGALRNREQFLTDQLGRPPSLTELSDDLKWPVKKVKLLRSEIKRDIVGNQGLDSIARKNAGKVEELLQGLYYDVPPVQQKILEHTFGWGGSEKLDVRGMAKMLNMPEAKVRYEKDRIAKRIQKDYSDVLGRL
jgi:DNA-directed RNA polymerase specialized sigma subunit